jgi:glucosamine--fructose-6-phosphate aminotransferase (isomerizing)
MCGIVGYVGRRAAAPILLEGLRHLEYRGYDSAGLAIHDGRELAVVRAVGKLARLEEAVVAKPPAGTTGIGHTRWATHGRPSVANAHPHAAGQVAVVHNGIIENHALLRSELRRAGATFTSETDTEVVAHLVDRALAAGAPDLFTAVRLALRRLEGAYAIAVVARSAPDVVVVAKHRSPLIVGISEGEAICASDVPALLPLTRDVVVLEDGDMAELHPRGVRFATLDGHEVERRLRRIEGTQTDAEKGSYPHFMLKEIHEQPDAIESSLRGRLDLDAGLVNGAELGVPLGLPTSIDRVCFVACGTSHHASMAGRHWIEKLARIPATCDLASEVRDRDPVLGPRDLVIAVSQSGETADTLAAVEAAKQRGAKVLAIANVVESAIPRKSDGAVYTHAGPEIGVASTKCFTTQLSVMLQLAVHLGLERGALRRGRAREILLALAGVPELLRRVLARANTVEEAATRVAAARDVLFLGRGLGFPIALEGALKLKEVSYVHAEGYAAGEMKHGPIALIDEHTPVVVVAPRDAQHAKVASNMAEVRARGGRVVAVCTEGDDATAESAIAALAVPVAIDDVLPLLTVVPLQLLAYHAAVAKGTDVDQPRNLAKTVTVE